jgi:predicted ester cyclase
MSIAVFTNSIEQIWNNHDIGAIERFIDPNYVGVDPADPEVIAGIDGYKQHFVTLTTAFPDTHITIDDIFGVGELVAARWTVRATHTGDFGDIPPTGLRIDVTGMAMVRIVRRLLVVEHANSDTLGLLRQLGVIPFTTKLPAPLLF